MDPVRDDKGKEEEDGETGEPLTKEELEQITMALKESGEDIQYDLNPTYFKSDVNRDYHNKWLNYVEDRKISDDELDKAMERALHETPRPISSRPILPSKAILPSTRPIPPARPIFSERRAAEDNISLDFTSETFINDDSWVNLNNRSRPTIFHWKRNILSINGKVSLKLKDFCDNPADPTSPARQNDVLRIWFLHSKLLVKNEESYGIDMKCYDRPFNVQLECEGTFHWYPCSISFDPVKNSYCIQILKYVSNPFRYEDVTIGDLIYLFDVESSLTIFFTGEVFTVIDTL